MPNTASADVRVRSRVHRVLAGLLGPVVVAALALAAAGPAQARTGGPDAGGYTVTDSTEPGGPAGGPFTDIAATGTDTGNHFDDGTIPIRFPFAVPFYGQLRTAGLVSSNGNLQFTTNDPEYHQVFPETYGAAVVPFQTDLTTDGPGLGIFTRVFGTAPSRQFVVQWSTRTYDTGIAETFQVVLTEGSATILTRYLDVDRTPGVGVQGSASGIGGLALAYPGPLSRGLAVAYTTSSNSGVALTATRSTSVFGQSVGLTAQVSRTDGSSAAPTGTMSFYVGTSSTAIATVALNTKGKATLNTGALPVGTDDVRAVYSGDSSLTGSVGAVRLVVSAAATTTALAPADGSSVAFGGAVTATVTAVKPGAGTPTGSVTWSDGGSVIAGSPLTKGVATLPAGTLLPGTHQVRAQFLPSTDGYSPSDVTATLQVTPASTATVLTTSPSTPVAGKKLTLTATVKDTVAGFTPTGTVTFSDAGTVIGSASLSSTAKASFVITALPAGPHRFTAVYSGDTRFAGSQSG